ncbi:hypothetical protein ACFUS2_00625 [[Kitasatospora] papulosa]|uniref:hypothetical protein n=1 Tax=Streptomyces TaxID=1883 RepID=UPI0005607FA7|nr:hypothetical protein [Streptomyces sp. NRRL S-325]
MSDFEELATRKIAAHLSVTYSGLATLCAALPIPVTLPTGAVSNLEAIPAVRRLMDITEDQPLPEQQQATLFAVGAFWLGAMDSYSLLVREEFHSARAHSAVAALLMADDHMMDLTVWLADQQ